MFTQKEKNTKLSLLFTVRVVKNWNRLTTVVVQFLPLEILKMCLDMLLGNLLQLPLL